MVFENGVTNIQAAAFNGAHTVCILIKQMSENRCLRGSFNLFEMFPNPNKEHFGMPGLHHHFYLPEVDIQFKNGQRVLGSLVLSILHTWN